MGSLKVQLNLEYITGILGFIGALVVNEVWGYIKEKRNKEKTSLDTVIEKNTAAISQLNIAIVKLEMRIDHLSEKLTPIPKISADVNEAHIKIRNIQSKMELAIDVDK